MPNVCEGCGESKNRWSMETSGPWADRAICRDCRRQGFGLKLLTWASTFSIKVAQILPPNDPITVPVLRLLMAVDDVRRAQLQLVEAHERLDVVPATEKYLALGDWLYSLRLLFSHLHEAGIAMRRLDTNAKARVDTALAGNQKAMADLKELRQVFNAADYGTSFIARVRNTIGSHYDDAGVTSLVQAEITNDTVLESTVAELGGLARLADPLVREIMNRLAGGDFMTKEEHGLLVLKALSVGGHFTNFVDYLLDALLKQQPDAVLKERIALITIPPLVLRTREAVEEARRAVEKPDAP